MLVPGHVVALYVATAGQNGPGLGSDEKEVVLLVFVIIDVASESVSLVSPELFRRPSLSGSNNAARSA